MPRITALPALTTPANDDLLAIVDTSGAVTTKITRQNFLKGSALPTDTVTTASIADGAVTNAKLATGAGEPGGVWNTWSPTWGAISGGANTLGNGTIVARYKVVGKTVFFTIVLTFGSTTTSSGSDWSFSPPPVTPASTSVGIPLGPSSGIDQGVNEYLGDCRLFSTTQIQPRASLASGTYVTNGSFGFNSPFTFGNTDSLRLSGRYEAA